MAAAVLDDTALASWRRDGYVVLRGFADRELCDAQLEAAVTMCRREAERPGSHEGVMFVPEGHPASDASEPEDFVAKVFGLHRRPPFDRFVRDPRLLDALVILLGDDIDVFLSQFIFKGPEAYGQPWHQDSYYFPFSESHQVGVWLAVTRATLHNGCLSVVPGTHADPIHDHVPDDRPNATRAYTRIVGRDTSSAVALEMDPGDVLVFDSHVMHSSTDNETDDVRATFVCHYSRAWVADLTPGGSPVNDWVPVVRDGAPAGPSSGSEP